MSRNKAPSENTIRILCGRAAGMCEFEGCNKRLFYDDVTRSEFNNAFVAHIIASSVNGPRGDKDLSAKLSADISNLMLMCADHHKLIDRPQIGPLEYPVDRLKRMKIDHEEKVARLCGLFNVPETEIVTFTSPIKGINAVNINIDMAAQAVLPQKQPASKYGVNISVSSSFSYKSKEYWEDCMRQLNMLFTTAICNPYIQFNRMGFSVFPLAPIPLIIKLGELFGDKVECDVYQKTRVPDTWQWQSSEVTNSFTTSQDVFEVESNAVAMVISLTNYISDERIQEIGSYKSMYRISAERTGVDCINSPQDLSEFWHKYQTTCDDILNTYGRDVEIHLFTAMPVSAAFEVGRRYMQNTYPHITIFDECEGFFETLELGGERNE